ncbi:DUF2867 domain-containing protein [Rhodovulum sp. DZ06]|uniref:DUF2867 domain-containing protein n=1 Tax=Rhodovulum sp. DZ06 TaxID=3425126 RepID=UPI003D3398EA
MTVRRISPPADFPLSALKAPKDFLDCWEAAPADPSADAAALARAVMEGMPNWVRRLLDLRDSIVAPLGLKTARDLAAETGGPERIGFMRVMERRPDRIVLGEDDSHLDFRVAVTRADGRALMGTWVRPKNRLGRLYLPLVLPFHDLIVANGMRRLERG